MKKRNMIWIFLSIFPMVFSGCIWKSEYLKKLGIMDGQLKDTALENKKLQQKMEQLKKDWKEQQLAKEKAENENKQLAQKKKELEALLAEFQEKTKNLQAETDRCQENLKTLASSKGAMGGRLKKAMEQLEHFKKLAQDRKNIFDRLKLAFQSMVAAGKLKISMVKGMLVLQLAEKILFASGSATVKSEGQKAVAQVTELLIKTKRKWQVVGHTDTVGSANFNWRLSARRALAVLFVMLKNGMLPEMVAVAGFGQYQPTAPNDTKENKSKNRRTEIILVPDLEELQKYAWLKQNNFCFASNAQHPLKPRS